jgi:hypothetical protein
MDIFSMEHHLQKNNYLKSSIRTISQGRSNNCLHETDFRGGHLNQE